MKALPVNKLVNVAIAKKGGRPFGNTYKVGPSGVAEWSDGTGWVRAKQLPPQNPSAEHRLTLSPKELHGPALPCAKPMSN